MRLIKRGAVLAAVLAVGATGLAPAATKETPAKAVVVAQATIGAKDPQPKAFHVNGFVRAYDFTRQNASAGVGAANQASFNLGVSLHGQYDFLATPWSLGATYLYANPLNNCTTAASHLSPPCGRNAPPALNPDDTLPGFEMSTLYEAYLQYKSGSLFGRIGNQVINTPWANPSDSRIKPVAFQGADLSYKLSPRWTIEAMDMVRFEGRTGSSFDKSTLLTSYPAGNPGFPPNIYNPGGQTITTNGFALGRLGYTSPNGFSAELDDYAFANIANFVWATGTYTWQHSHAKPFLAVQLGSEKNAGSAVLGTISSSVYGALAGLSLTPNVTLSLGVDSIPVKSATIALPAGVTCTTKNTIAVAPGASLPYFLPTGGTANCVAGAPGTATIYYGGIASPYTDAYATDPLFTTSITQGMADRHSPGSSYKLTLSFVSDDKRFHAILSHAGYNYGNAAGASSTTENNVDLFYYLGNVGPGPYHGLVIRNRYAERTQTYTSSYGGLPLFKYNRVQLEYDF